MTNSILLEKSLKFAARIVKLHKYLIKEKHETIISKQIIRSDTSIGANANEAIYGCSINTIYPPRILRIFRGNFPSYPPRLLHSFCPQAV